MCKTEAEYVDNSNIVGFLTNLKYRIEITKRARIKASARLRNKHLRFERIIHAYSILILILTIWFLGDGDTENVSTKFLLILSLTITFISMYLNMKNYKERAGNFETNYQNLDILLNRIERKQLDASDIDNNDIKQFQREYEKLLIDKENHLAIDYREASEDYYRSQARKSQQVDNNNPGFWKNFKKKFNGVQWSESFKYACLILLPIIIIIILFTFEKLMDKFG